MPHLFSTRPFRLCAVVRPRVVPHPCAAPRLAETHVRETHGTPIAIPIRAQHGMTDDRADRPTEHLAAHTHTHTHALAMYSCNCLFVNLLMYLLLLHAPQHRTHIEMKNGHFYFPALGTWTVVENKNGPFFGHYVLTQRHSLFHPNEFQIAIPPGVPKSWPAAATGFLTD